MKNIILTFHRVVNSQDKEFVREFYDAYETFKKDYLNKKVFKYDYFIKSTDFVYTNRKVFNFYYLYRSSLRKIIKK